MKQVLQARNNSAAAVRDVPAPPCPPGNVLVRTAYSVISSGTERTRVEMSQKSLLGKARERPDLVREVIERARREGLAATRTAVQRKLSEETAVGYSCAGEVIEVGERVSGLRPGDLVACAGAGHANHAEIVSVPANLCAKVPTGVDLRDASFATIAAIALHGVRLADVKLGERVAVIGCGLVGQLALRLLASAGAETVAIEIDETRLSDARQGGADHACTPAEAKGTVAAVTGGVGADAVLVTAAASSSEPLHLGAEIARDRGTVVLVGAVPIEFPRGPLYEKELSFRVSRSYGPGRYDLEYEERGLDYPIGFVRWTEKRNMEAILELIGRGRLALADLVDEEFPVDRAPEAYERLVGDGPPLRGALVLSYPPQNGTAVKPPVTLSPPVSSGNGAVAKARSTSLRVGLIGPGSFASRVIVPAFVATGATLEVVAGGAGPSAEAATRTLGFARAAESAEALIDDRDVDIVAISTRHGAHAATVTAALEAGKHVFCEKPLALTEEELGRVIAAAENGTGILAVGFNRRFSSLLRSARDAVLRPGENIVGLYRVSAGRIGPDHWVHDLADGGGRVLGEGCHFIDSLAFLAGSPVRALQACGYSSVGLPVQAWDNVVLSLEFENGSVGTVAYVADGASAVPKERVEVFGGRRTAILDDYRQLTTYSGHERQETTARTQDKGHQQEIRAFVEGVRSGMPPVPLDEVANVSLATLGAVEALRTGSRVQLAAAGDISAEVSA